MRRRGTLPTCSRGTGPTRKRATPAPWVGTTYPLPPRPTFLLLRSGAAYLAVPPLPVPSVRPRPRRPPRRRNRRLAPSRSQRRRSAMDILGWLGWALVGVLGLLWTLIGWLWAIVWFLISGWVSTL